MTERDKPGLRSRTLKRNDGTWVEFLADTPLAELEATLDGLGGATVQNPMAYTDDLMGIKESQRDRTIQQDQAEIDQSRLLADMKVSLERERLTIRIAAQKYRLAVEWFVAQVRDVIMTIHEYAASVERETLTIQGHSTQLAVAREGVRLQELNARVIMEMVKQKMVEAEVAEYRVKVAQANVRAVMAQVELERARIELVDAQMQSAMIPATKAGLQAQIAMTFAEALMKQISQITYEVEKATISKEFGFIATRLADMLAIWDSKLHQTKTETDTQINVLNEMTTLLLDEKTAEDLHLTAEKIAQAVFQYREQVEGIDNIDALREQLVPWLMLKKGVLTTEHTAKMSLMDKDLWAKELINKAQCWVYGNHKRLSSEARAMTELIITQK